ncbi:MAG TPA: hypothetical protein VFW00_07440 [Rhodocyclaceae bacterium]|nr:hypothetical protein [Rhodocyclaceae bacterium]
MRLYQIITALILSVAAASAGAGINNLGNGVIDVQGFVFDAGTNAYIGCYLSGNSINCFAGDGNGNTASCSTTDPRMKGLLPMINKTSSIQFITNAQGTCTSIDVNNGGWGFNNDIFIGAKSISEPVIISSMSMAYGAVSAPPSSSIPGEGINCDTMLGNIACSAQDSAGNIVSCRAIADSSLQTFDDMLTAVTAINEASQITFTWAPGKVTKGELGRPICTSISVSNGSYYFPQ